MAAFARTSYNVATYASFRPTYPHQLFDFVFQYHARSPDAKWDTAVDLGCGTGQATFDLARFRHVVGIDPSPKMLDCTQQQLNERPGLSATTRYQFVQSTSEDLHFLQDGSVDLIVSAQAGHWFDWSKVWPELARVMRQGASAAFWGYSEFRLTRYPSLSPLITEYSQGTDPITSLGPYWQQPGRWTLDNHLLKVPEPTDVAPGKFWDYQRVFYTGEYHPSLPSPRPIILHKKMTWADLLAYFRTWSSLFAYHERYPQDRERQEGDIAARFCQTLKDSVEMEGGMVGDQDEVEVDWPMAMILARRA